MRKLRVNTYWPAGRTTTGNIEMPTSHQTAREPGGPKLLAQLLVYPAVDQGTTHLVDPLGSRLGQVLRVCGRVR